MTSAPPSPRNQRHQWFRSLKSSQALTQSVFRVIRAFGRLDLLQNVSAECGRPAFIEDHRGTTLDFEHEVRCLGEPRPTSIDVLLRGPQKRVAIECKLTEQEFGRCSRPQLRPDDTTYSEQHCDGSYRVQRGRRERCALTEIGVQYWKHLPHLFAWAADRDHEPCPLESVYQLALNALAAALTLDAELDPATGHALVVTMPAISSSVALQSRKTNWVGDRRMSRARHCAPPELATPDGRHSPCA